jgi:hypothetical protein
MAFNIKFDRVNKSFLFFSIILFIGIIIRMGLVLFSDFPLNDGGLFYSMVNDLVANHFKLPLFTTYNQNTIPFAYPPLSLYLAGVLKYMGMDLFTVMHFLPVIFNLFTIPAFYLLSRKLLKTENEILFATLTFAVLPPAYEWLIMGGGLTRSPAYLLSILAWNQSLIFIDTHAKKDLLFTILLAGIAGLCHIEICMVIVILILITFIFKDKRAHWIKYGAIFVGGVLLVMSPYVFTIIHNHGILPLKAALFSGEFEKWKGLVRFLVGNISGEAFYTPLIVIALFGFGVCLQKKEYYFPACILVVVLFNPRSLDRSMVLFLSLLSGVGYQSYIYPIFSKPDAEKSIATQGTKNDNGRMAISWIGIILLSYLILRSAITSMAFLMIPGASLNHVSLDDRTAMTWVKNNTSMAEKFLVLSKPVTWQIDHRSEWFPAITERKSVTTVQGSEWLDGGVYYSMQELHEDVSKCFLRNMSCLNAEINKYNLDYSMIYISGKLSKGDGYITPYPIEMELRSSPDYRLMYENDTVSIFELKQ